MRTNETNKTVPSAKKRNEHNNQQLILISPSSSLQDCMIPRKFPATHRKKGSTSPRTRNPGPPLPPAFSTVTYPPHPSTTRRKTPETAGLYEDHHHQYSINIHSIDGCGSIVPSAKKRNQHNNQLIPPLPSLFS